MANNTLHIMYLDMAQAANEIQGINGFYMVDESEINSLKPVSFPIIVVEVPTSSVSNINKAWEEYEMTVFVLQRQIKAYYTASQIQKYDETMSLFTEWVSQLMGQRDGDYVVEKESFEIERVKEFTNHLCIGTKVNFTLLASSKLQYYTADPVSGDWNITVGLRQLFNGKKNVNIYNGGNYLTWSPALGSNLNKAITQHEVNHIPSWTSPQFTFSLPNSNPAEAFKLSDYVFSTASFSFFFKMSVDDAEQTDHQTILDIRDTSSGDGFLFGLNAGSSSGALDGRPFFRVNDDGSGDVDDLIGNSQMFVTTADLEPLDDTVVGIVNDATNDKLRLYVGVGDDLISHEIDGSCSNQLAGCQILIGASELSEWDFSYRGFVGTISHIAIYDSAINVFDAKTISTDLNNL